MRASLKGKAIEGTSFRTLTDLYNQLAGGGTLGDSGTLPINVTQASGGVGLTGLLGAIWGWIKGATGFTSYAPNVTLSGSTVPDAQSLPAHIVDPSSGEVAGVDAYNNLKVALMTALSAAVDSIASTLFLGTPTAGTYTGGTAVTTTSGGSIQIAADADVTNPAGIVYHTVTIGAAATGAAIASALQTAIQNLADIYQTFTVSYGTNYVFTSGSQGLGSKVRIIAAATRDIAAALNLTTANGATYSDGVVGTQVSAANPLPIGAQVAPAGKKQAFSWSASSLSGYAGTTQSLTVSNCLTLQARSRAYEVKNTLDQAVTAVQILPYVSTFGNQGISLVGVVPATFATLAATAGGGQTNDAWLVADSITLKVTFPATAVTTGSLAIEVVEVIGG
jgi:hypothetical protein